MAHDQRKADHIRINLEENVQFPALTNGFEHYRFMHQALPELDLAEIDTGVALLGKRLRLPLLISSMTGGTERPAHQPQPGPRRTGRGIAMGLGSQRAGIEQADTADTFRVRGRGARHPAVRQPGRGPAQLWLRPISAAGAVEMIEADALILHLNPLQEALQADGDGNWKGLLGKIETVCRTVGVPVIVKEVGWGFSEQSARRLAEAGVAVRCGGCRRHLLERGRVPPCADRAAAAAGQAFADWGIPTAEALLQAQRGAPGLPLIASGGMRNGIEVAKALALGRHGCRHRLPVPQGRGCLGRSGGRHHRPLPPSCAPPCSAPARAMWPRSRAGDGSQDWMRRDTTFTLCPAHVAG